MLNKLHKIIFIFIALSLSVALSAANCPQHYLNGIIPAMKKSLTYKFRELCSTAFAVGHSGVTRSGLWAAEVLTPQSVTAGQSIPRKNTFHVDKRLPENERAELNDYRGSGYDRGHLAPSADMPSRKAQNESFALSNMIPQHPDNNRKLHAGIEKAIRGFVKRYQQKVYVVTGVLYMNKNPKVLNKRLYVPSHVWKAIYVPEQNQGGVYVQLNNKGRDYQTLSFQEFARYTGIQPFPAASQAKLLKLPKPF